MPGTLYTPNGKAAPIMTNWKPPENSPYFGFATPHGKVAVKLDAVTICAPQIIPPSPEHPGGPTGKYVIQCGTNVMTLEPADGFRLLKRMGWKESSGIEGV